MAGAVCNRPWQSRVIARRNDISACAGAGGADVSACAAGNGAGDDATTGQAVSVVEGLTLVIGVRSANSPQQRIASGLTLRRWTLTETSGVPGKDLGNDLLIIYVVNSPGIAAAFLPCDDLINSRS